MKFKTLQEAIEDVVSAKPEAASEKPATPAKEAKDDPKVGEAFTMGFRAADTGATAADNPFDDGTPAAKNWLTGFKRSKELTVAYHGDDTTTSVDDEDLFEATTPEVSGDLGSNAQFAQDMTLKLVAGDVDAVANALKSQKKSAVVKFVQNLIKNNHADKIDDLVKAMTKLNESVVDEELEVKDVVDSDLSSRKDLYRFLKHIQNSLRELDALITKSHAPEWITMSNKVMEIRTSVARLMGVAQVTTDLKGDSITEEAIDEAPSVLTPAAALEKIRAGDRVKISSHYNPESPRSGKAVMKGPHGWVLNMGGQHGTPGIADEKNIVSVNGVRVQRDVMEEKKNYQPRMELDIGDKVHIMKPGAKGGMAFTIADVDYLSGEDFVHLTDQKGNKHLVYFSEIQKLQEGLADDFEKELGGSEDEDLLTRLDKPKPTAPKPTDNYGAMPIYRLAEICRRDWKKVNYAAVPYLDAMSSLENITDKYGMDDGISVVAYFLSNASSWKGDVAKAVKAELKKRLNAAYKRS